MKKLFTWKNFNKLFTSTQFLILLFGVVFTLFQIQDIRNNQLNRKNDLSMRYYDRLTTSTNRKIELAIEHNRFLFGRLGSFNEDQIDDYLGNLHDVGWNLNLGLLDNNMVCSNFSDIVKHAWQNLEIQKYLLEIRKTDPNYFLGFDDLYNFIKTCK